MLPGLVLTKSSSLKVGLEAREEGYCSVRFDILDCSKPFLSICKVIYILIELQSQKKFTPINLFPDYVDCFFFYPPFFLLQLNPTYMKRILHFKNITFKSSYNWFKIDILRLVQQNFTNSRNRSAKDECSIRDQTIILGLQIFLLF